MSEQQSEYEQDRDSIKSWGKFAQECREYSELLLQGIASAATCELARRIKVQSDGQQPVTREWWMEKFGVEFVDGDDQCMELKNDGTFWFTCNPSRMKNPTRSDIETLARLFGCEKNG